MTDDQERIRMLAAANPLFLNARPAESEIHSGVGQRAHQRCRDNFAARFWLAHALFFRSRVGIYEVGPQPIQANEGRDARNDWHPGNKAVSVKN